MHCSGKAKSPVRREVSLVRAATEAFESKFLFPLNHYTFNPETSSIRLSSWQMWILDVTIAVAEDMLAGEDTTRGNVGEVSLQTSGHAKSRI